MSMLSLLSCLVLVTILSEVNPLSFLIVLTAVFVILQVTMLLLSVGGSLLSALRFVTVLVSVIFFYTQSLFVFFVLYELSLLPVSIIILIFGYQPEKLRSTTYFLLYTVVCSSPLFVFVIRSGWHLYYSFQGLGGVTALLLSLAILVKSPIYILHSWLPKAHVEASLHGSMILSGIMLKKGGYGLLVISFYIQGTCNIYLFITLWGGIVCRLLCCRSWDIKVTVAYSSVVHMGVVTLGCLVGSESRFWAAAGIMVAHSLVSPMLFRLAYTVYISKSSRSWLHCHSFAVSPLLLLVIGIYWGLNFGLPPSLSFYLEVLLLRSLGSVSLLSCIPLLMVAFLVFVFSILFYVQAVAGPPSFYLGPTQACLVSAPGLVFSFLLTFSTSLILVV